MWRGAKLILLVMIISAGILNYADRQIIAVLKPSLQHDLHWTDIDYANLNSLFQLASAAALLFAGRVVDAIGWRRANPVAVGSWSLAAGAHALVAGGVGFGAARFALGATEALGTPTAIKTMAAAFAPAERTLALGLMNAANGLGAIITPLAIPLLALAFGWRICFVLTGGLGCLWVAAWLLTRPDRGVSVEPAPGIGHDEVGKDGTAAPIGRGVWRAVLRDRRTWAIAAAKVLSDQVWWLLLFWAPDLLSRDFHLGLSSFGGPLAIMYLSASAGALIVGQTSKTLLERGVSLDVTRKSGLLVCALLAMPLSLTTLAPNAAVATAILALTLAAHQGYSTHLFALTTDIIPRQSVATTISFCAFLGNLAGLAILQAAGHMLAAGLGYGLLLAYASVSYLLGLAIIHLLLPRLQPAA
ncbi:MAG: MFS transporter [Alphaproteobacteria bacterium]|nr:MFS transporter [Alphaproteobacteria bacterium]